MTKIKFIGSDPSQALQLHHVYSAFPFFHGNTFFQIGSKKVHWKGQSALVEDKTGICLAVFRAKFFETKNRKLGTLLVTTYGNEFLDIIMVSALIEQERTDEAEFEVKFSVQDSLTVIETDVRKGGRGERLYQDVM